MEISEKIIECPRCRSRLIKKNGHLSNGKQNYRCKSCGRQFVESSQEWHVSNSDKDMINRLLLERISLNGICRSVGVSQSWLLNYLKELYADLPDNLNAELNLPDMESWLSERMDEEIERLEMAKKNSYELEAYRDEAEIARLEELRDDQELMLEQEVSFFFRPDFLSSLAEGSSEELLVNDLYSMERGRRVEVFGIELDEMWSFVQNKAYKVWIWLALNPLNRQIIGLHLGGRTKEDAQKLWESIHHFFRTQVGFFSDYWKAYQAVFDPERHFAVGKASGLTAHIERFNCTMRQRVSRLVRKALSFSKSMKNHMGAIKYFICHYNLHLAALII